MLVVLPAWGLGSGPAVYAAAIAEAATAADLCSSSTVLSGTVIETATAAEVVVGTVGVAFDPTTLNQTTLSNANLTVTHANTTGNAGARVASLASTGKYYFEVTVGSTSSNFNAIGILLSSGIYTDLVTNGTNCTATYHGTGNIFSNNVSAGKTLGAITAGNVIGVAVDLTARKAWLRKGSGNWNGDATHDPATGAGGVTISAGSFAPAVGFGTVGSGNAMTANFGAATYANAAPSGFGNWVN